MDNVVTTLVDSLVSGGADAILALGWVFFIIERYYVASKKEQQFRDDLTGLQESYSELGKGLTEALGKFHVVLEVIRDRVR